MLQTMFAVIIVVCALIYLLLRFLPLRSKEKLKMQKSSSCGCDGCPVASRKKTSL